MDSSLFPFQNYPTSTELLLNCGSLKDKDAWKNYLKGLKHQITALNKFLISKDNSLKTNLFSSINEDKVLLFFCVSILITKNKRALSWSSAVFCHRSEIIVKVLVKTCEEWNFWYEWNLPLSQNTKYMGIWNFILELSGLIRNLKNEKQNIFYSIISSLVNMNVLKI